MKKQLGLNNQLQIERSEGVYTGRERVLLRNGDRCRVAPIDAVHVVGRQEDVFSEIDSLRDWVDGEMVTRLRKTSCMHTNAMTSWYRC